ncbi:MAG TPA: MFS transporter [Nocardioides sp.]|nr:MFS transporter [Nocardioides sp.]
MPSDQRRGPLYALIAANAVSQLGNVVAVVAVPWYVLETTGSAALTGVSAFATTLPLAVGALVGGPVVQRLGTRRASVTGDLGAALFLAAIPLADLWNVLTFPVLCALVFLAGMSEAPSRTARRSMLPDLAQGADMPLERANSLSTTTEHLGYVAGAPLAGVLVTGLGGPVALLADASSFLAAAIVVGVAVPTTRVATDPLPALSGLRLVLGTPLLRVFFTIWTVGGFLVAPVTAVLLPAYARENLDGAASLAAAVTAYGVGGLVGTLGFGLVGRRISRRRFFVAMWVVYPALSLLLVAEPGLTLLLVVLFGVGLTTGAYDPFEVTIQQELVPAELRPQAFSLLLAVEMAVVPVAMLSYGFVIEAAGLRSALLALGVGNVLLGLYAILVRPARTL